MRRAIQTFHVGLPDGQQATVAQGQELPDNDPLVKGREALFEHVTDPEQPKLRRKSGTKPKAKDADGDA